MCTACTGSLHGSYTSVYGPSTAVVRPRVTCRVPFTRRPCTRPVNTSSPAKTACTRPYNGCAVYTARTRPCMGRAHGPSIPPVYMTVYGPSVRTSSAVYMARTRPRKRDVYTAMYGPCTRPCTRHVYGRVHVSTCTRVVYTAVYGPCARPFSAVYIARTRPCNGPCTRPLQDRVQGRLGRVYGR